MPHPNLPDSDKYAYYNTAYELGEKLGIRRVSEFGNDPTMFCANPGPAAEGAKPVSKRHIGLLGAARGKKGFENPWRRLHSGRDEMFSTGMTYHFFTGYWEALTHSSLHIGVSHVLAEEMVAFLQVVSNARIQTTITRSEDTFVGSSSVPATDDPNPPDTEVLQHTNKRDGAKQENMALFHIFRDKQTLDHIKKLFAAGDPVDKIVHSMTGRAIETTVNAIARPTSTFTQGAIPDKYLDAGEVERNAAKKLRHKMVRRADPKHKRRHSVGSQAYDAVFPATLQMFNRDFDTSARVKRDRSGERSRSVSPERELRASKKKKKQLSQSQGAVGGNNNPQ